MSKILATVLLGGTTLTSATFAQDATAEGDAVKSVYERYRPDYDAPGVRSGSFLFYPSVTGEGKFDSNIYAQESGETDDFIAIIKPSFNLASDWNSSFFSLSADADIGRYLDNSAEDYEDFGVKAEGRKDISYGTDVHANVGYEDKHEDRGSADVSGAAAEQTTYSLFTAGAGFKRDVSVLSLAVDGEYTKRDFDDVARVGGGTINNDDRDRERYKATFRAGYELSDGYEAFVRVVGDRVKYDNSKEDGGPQRSSNGYEVVGGAAFDLTGKAKGEMFAGYLKRAYDSDTLGTIDGVNFGASLLWNATGLTSFRGTVKRSVDETSVGTAAGVPAGGVLSTLISGRVEHELRRNVLLGADLSYTKQSYERDGATIREDDLFGAKLGVKYLLTRNFNVNAGYAYDYRNTDQQGQDYERHSFRVGVTGQW